MEIELVSIEKENINELKMMLLDYFKEIDESKIKQTNEGEEIDYPYLDSYWTEVNRIPLNILYNYEKIGFVLINNWTVCKEFKANKSIAEFYIKPRFRRQGIGKKVAHELFEKYKGKWEIRQSSTNISAIKFWKEVIKEFRDKNSSEIPNEEDKKIDFIQLIE